jgi:hypothetical protein
MWKEGSAGSVVSTVQPVWLMFDTQQGQGFSVLKGFDYVTIFARTQEEVFFLNLALKYVRSSLSLHMKHRTMPNRTALNQTMPNQTKSPSPNHHV